MRLVRSPLPQRSRSRQLANAVAAIFLAGVVGAVGLTVWQVVNPDYDEYDTEVLRRDLDQFKGAVDEPSSLVDVQPCTGEGSVPAAAQRRYVVPGTIATVRRDLVAEATMLGWVATPPPEGLAPSPDLFAFEKGDRDLFVNLTVMEDSRVEVALGVTGGDMC